MQDRPRYDDSPYLDVFSIPLTTIDRAGNQQTRMFSPSAMSMTDVSTYRLVIPSRVLTMPPIPLTTFLERSSIQRSCFERE